MAELHNGILSIMIPRSERFVERGVQLEPEMQISHMFKFQLIEGALVNLSEFVVLQDEAAPAARALREAGFMVSALHNHELDINPLAFHLHASASGEPLDLAQRIRALLDMAGMLPM